MSAKRRITAWIWLIIPAAALALVLGKARTLARHIDEVSRLAGGADLSVDATSSTGYAGSLRPLVVPVRDPRSLQWIVQAQELHARGTWHLDRVTYDNAPTGREVWSPSPYRWWLMLAGRTEAAISGRPVAAAIERTALWADPLLHGLLVLAAAGFLWRGVGVVAAAWCAGALALCFPLGASFMPGRPDEMSLSWVCAVFSVLPVAAALVQPGARARPVWFFIAGAAGGLGGWINIHLQLVVLAGLVLGGGVSAWWRRPTAGAGSDEDTPAAPAWRVWAASAACVTLLGWVAEQTADRLSLAGARWDLVHPGYVLLWLGCGELLARIETWARQGRAAWGAVGLGATVLSVAAIVAPLALAVRAGFAGIFGPGETLLRVSDLGTEVGDGGIAAWFGAMGFSLTAVAALLPLLGGVGVAATVLIARRGAARMKGGVVFVLGVALVAVAGACFRAGDWGMVAVAFAVLGVPAAGFVLGPACGWGPRLGMILAASACLGGGAVAAWPRAGAGVSRAEVQALVERDLAWWMASQAPERDAIVLAPPDLTAALIYHGALRGLGSPYRENEDGFRFSVRLSAASTPDEGQALVDSRGVRYLVVPSWDGFLDQYARLGAVQPEKSLIALLHQWQPPRWLRAVPYQMPQVEGFSGESVAVFQVVDVQDNPTALSRLAEYFLEVGQLASARRLASALKELYPTEPAAFVARAQVAVAARDAGGFREIVEAILPMLEDGSAETLTWDRRVSLALILAQARHADAAREQAQRCLDEVDEPALRSLTNQSLQRFLALLKSAGLEIGDPASRDLALRLLPPELRGP